MTRADLVFFCACGAYKRGKVANPIQLWRAGDRKITVNRREAQPYDFGRCAECEHLGRKYCAVLQHHASNMWDYQLALAAWDADWIRATKRAIRRTEEALETHRLEILAHEGTHPPAKKAAEQS